MADAVVRGDRVLDARLVRARVRVRVKVRVRVRVRVKVRVRLRLRLRLRVRVRVRVCRPTLVPTTPRTLPEGRARGR